MKPLPLVDGFEAPSLSLQWLQCLYLAANKSPSNKSRHHRGDGQPTAPAGCDPAGIEYSGYLSSPKTVTVNARVSGLIEQAPFREGAIVQAGDLLFKIDPRPFEADLDNKKAAVDQAKALAERTKADFARSRRCSRLG